MIQRKRAVRQNVENKRIRLCSINKPVRSMDRILILFLLYTLKSRYLHSGVMKFTFVTEKQEGILFLGR